VGGEAHCSLDTCDPMPPRKTAAGASPTSVTQAAGHVTASGLGRASAVHGHGVYDTCDGDDGACYASYNPGRDGDFGDSHVVVSDDLDGDFGVVGGCGSARGRRRGVFT
jgi:hypothetical protein